MVHAPILDMLKTIRAMDTGIDLLAAPSGDQASAYLDGFYMHVLPMLDGILRRQAKEITRAACEALALHNESEEAQVLSERLSGLAV